jgi:hypothetical protein
MAEHLDITDLLKAKPESKYRLRSNGQNNLIIPNILSTRRLMIVLLHMLGHSFIWTDSLPVDIRIISNIESFKETSQDFSF